MATSMDQLGRLKPVELREVWISEPQGFTPWLARKENLDQLAETLGMRLEFEAQEKDVGPFRADILCTDSDDKSWVLIENQLERTDHTHLGQILTYAAGLHACTICWIAKEFTEEHRAAVTWLNEITADTVRFFGVEIKLFRIEDSPIAPSFDVVCKPNNWSREVSRGQRNLSPRQLQQQKFWTALAAYLRDRRGSIKLSKPQPQNWAIAPIGRAGYCLDVNLHFPDKWISVGLYLDGPEANEDFDKLKKQQDDIEEDLKGQRLEWMPLPNKKACRIRVVKATDPSIEDGWPDQQEWIASTLERFDNAFRARIKAL